MTTSTNDASLQHLLYIVHNVHVARSVQMSERTYSRLVGRVESFDDTAEDVIVRLLDATETGGAIEQDAPPRASTASSVRAAPGSILPVRQYWPAIRQALDESGGSAHANDVIERVGALLEDRLRPADFDELEIGEVRWRNRVRFARLRMKEAGLLRADSPRGIWQLSGRGSRDDLRSEAQAAAADPADVAEMRRVREEMDAVAALDEPG
jgi:hypothetical protein